ncbi:MAG: hypothetical protein JNM56_17145 [Planctomycetia bacterium]|nr:hypothetical protein [Planctomycetia bacterium]
MKRRLGLWLLGSVLMFAASLVYCPWLRVEHWYRVVPVRRGEIVMMGWTDELVRTNVEPIGYRWAWQREPPSWFGTKVHYVIDGRRLLPVWLASAAGSAAVLIVLLAGRRGQRARSRAIP